MVEQRFCKPKVAGSIPASGTKFYVAISMACCDGTTASDHFNGCNVLQRNTPDFRHFPLPSGTSMQHSCNMAAENVRMPEEQIEQQALFNIEGPDDDGCVWICSAEGRDVWCQNLGPADEVAEVLCQWLGSIDHLEND